MISFFGSFHASGDYSLWTNAGIFPETRFSFNSRSIAFVQLSLGAPGAGQSQHQGTGWDGPEFWPRPAKLFADMEMSPKDMHLHTVKAAWHGKHDSKKLLYIENNL